jgi:hypothetical protein
MYVSKDLTSYEWSDGPNCRRHSQRIQTISTRERCNQSNVVQAVVAAVGLAVVAALVGYCFWGGGG